jgi:hypothetical protein
MSAFRPFRTWGTGCGPKQAKRTPQSILRRPALVIAHDLAAFRAVFRVGRHGRLDHVRSAMGGLLPDR